MSESNLQPEQLSGLWEAVALAPWGADERLLFILLVLLWIAFLVVFLF